MASIIRIKRSSTSGNPATLGAGELAYSALADNGSNGGDRLYIGMGTETAGNAVNHVIIGGKYYTGLVDAGGSGGTLTTNAKSIPVLSSTGTIDKWLVGNLQLTGNTLSSTNTNGDINITPNGTGKTIITNIYTDVSTSLQEYIQDVAGGGIVDSSEIDATYDDTAGTTSLALKTTGVTAGSYGSATAIPTFTVDSKGRLSAAGSVSVATTLNLTGDTGSDGISLLSETLAIVGGEGIDTAITANTLTISAEDATTTNKGVASFDTANFTVTAGAVSAKTITLGSSTLTLGSTTTGLAGLSSLGVTGNATIGGTLGVTGVVTLSSTLGVAGDFAVNTNKFTVSATSGNTSVAGTLGVTGNSTLGGTLAVTGATTLSSTLAVTNDLSVNTNKFNVQASTGNTTLAGTLGVTGAATLSSTLAVTGNTTIGGTLGVTGVATFGANVDMNAHKITNLAEPTADSDAATKYYVDAARSGLDVKGSVRVATTGNITLSNTQTIDGVALSVGDRVLVKDQTTGSQNGIYVVASGSWTRATDADNNPGGEVTSGMFCFVEEGAVNSDTGFVLTTNDPITLGTTALSFTLFSTSGTLIAGNGLSKNGYTLEVNVAGSGGIEIVSDNLQLKSSVAGAGLTYTSGVVDVVGTANRITVNADSIDIASTYVGQTSITTLGTVTTGTWNGSVIADAYINDALTISGGTVNNTPIGATTRSTGAFTTLAANGAATLTSTLAVSGAATLSSTLGVTGNVTLSANLTGAGAGTSTIDGFNIDGGTY
jgi:hypothetical protein